jgi:hypothetical protein
MGRIMLLSPSLVFLRGETRDRVDTKETFMVRIVLYACPENFDSSMRRQVSAEHEKKEYNNGGRFLWEIGEFNWLD